jgi:hypothetical protein
MKRYVVAISYKEACDLVQEIGWDTKAEAMKHLEDVKKLPTDPFYGNQYKVFEVKV